MRRLQLEHVVLAVFAIVLALAAGGVLWLLGGERSLARGAEERLGTGAACGRPDHETVLCVHAGRRYLCVRGRSGDVACAETIGGGPER